MFSEKTFLEKVRECIGLSFTRCSQKMLDELSDDNQLDISKRFKFLNCYLGKYNDEIRYLVGISKIEDDESAIWIYRSKKSIDYNKPITDEEVDKVCFMLHFNVTKISSFPETKICQMRIGKGI